MVMVEPRAGQLVQVVNAQPRTRDIEEGKYYENGDIFEVGYTWGYDSLVKPGITTTQNVELWHEEFERLSDSLGLPESELYEVVEEFVDRPSHYTQGKFETIEVIEEITQGYDDGYIAYCVGNTLKYLARAPYKHDTPLEDLRKAAKYLEFAIAREESRQ